MSAGRRSCWRSERTWSALLTGQCAPGGVIKSSCLKFRIHSILLIIRDIQSSQQALQNYDQYCINLHINGIYSKVPKWALGRNTRLCWLCVGWVVDFATKRRQLVSSLFWLLRDLDIDLVLIFTRLKYLWSPLICPGNTAQFLAFLPSLVHCCTRPSVGMSWDDQDK